MSSTQTSDDPVFSFFVLGSGLLTLIGFAVDTCDIIDLVNDDEDEVVIMSDLESQDEQPSLNTLLRPGMVRADVLIVMEHAPAYTCTFASGEESMAWDVDEACTLFEVWFKDGVVNHLNQPACMEIGQVLRHQQLKDMEKRACEGDKPAD